MSASAGSVGVEIVALNAQKAISEMKAYVTSLTQMESATKKATDTINQSFAGLGKGGGINTLTTGIKQIDTQVKSTTGTVTQGANQMGQAFTKVGTEITQSSQKASTGLKQIDTTTKQVASGTNQISAAYKKVGTDIDSSVKKGDLSLKQLNTTTKTVATGTTQVSTAFQKVGTDITSSVTKANTGLKSLETTTKTVASGTTQVSTAYQKVGTDITRAAQTGTNSLNLLNNTSKGLTTTVQQTSAAVQQQTTAFSAGRNTMQQVADTTNLVLTAQGGLSTAMKGSTQEINLFKQAQEQSLATMTKTSAETDKVVSSTGEFKTAMVGVIGSVSALGASVFSLWHSYDSLRLAQVSATASANKTSKAYEAVEKLQTKINKIVAEGGKGTTDYVNKLRDLQQAKTALGIQLEKEQTIQERLTEKTASYYLNVIPEAISTIGSLTSVVSGISQTYDALHKSTEGAGDAAEVAGASMEGLGSAVAEGATITSGGISLWDKMGNALEKGSGKGIKTTGIFQKMGVGIAGAFGRIGSAAVGFGSAIGTGLGAIGSFLGAASGIAVAVGASVVAIVAAVAALTLYATNTLGARDAMNEWGKSLGEMVPQFKIVGDALVGVLGTLGLTGETVAQTTQHFNDAATGWNDAVASMQASDNILVQDIGLTIGAISNQFSKMGVEMGTQLEMSKNAWNEFVTALGEGDFEGAVDIVIESLSAIPDIISKLVVDGVEAFSKLGLGIEVFASDASKIITDWATGTGDAIGTAFDTVVGIVETAVGLIDAVIGRIVPGWSEIKSQVGAWVTTNIVEPLTTWYEMIAVPAGQLWTYIVGAATSIKTTVDTWVTTNIVTPLKSWWTMVTIDPSTLWSSIFGVASSIKTAVDTWVQTNIVDPILAFPKNIQVGADAIWKAIIGTTASITETVKSWVETNIVTPIEGIPSLIQGKAAEIVTQLLTGDWKTPIDNFLKTVWSGFEGAAKFISGQGGAPAASAPTTPQLTNKELADNTALNQQTAKAIFESGQTGTIEQAMEEVKKRNLYKPQTNEPSEVTKPVTAPPKPTVAAAASLTQAGVARGVPLGGTGTIGGIAQGTALGLGTGIGIPHGVQAGRAFPTPTKTVTPQPTITPTSPLATLQTVGGVQMTPKGGASGVPKTWDRGPSEAEKASLKSRGPPGGAAGAFALPPPEEIVKSTAAYINLNKAVTDASNSNSQYGRIIDTQSGQELLLRQGQESRVKTMNDLEMANINAVGSNKEYAKQIESQNLLGVAYESGLRKQETALMDQQVALAASQGATAKLNEQMATGLPQALAFAEGVNKQENALINMQLATAGTQGELTKLSSQLADGTAQAAAFESGYTNAAMSAKQMQVDVASLAGEVSYLGESLTKSEDILARQNMAFLEGQKGAIEWGMSLQTAAQSEEGFRTGIIQSAQALGVDLPEGFAGSNEAMQQWIEMTKGAGSSFDSFISSIQSGADSIRHTLGDALLESNDALNDAIDTMEEEAGFNFSEGLRNAFESSAGLDAIATTATELMEHIEALGQDITPAQFNELRNGFSSSISETFDDVKDELGPKGTELVQSLLAAINAPIDFNAPNSIEQHFGKVKAVMIEMAGQGSATAQKWVSDMGTINGIHFDDAKNSFVDLNGNLVSFADAAKIASGETTGLGTAAATTTPQIKAFYDTLASFGGLQTVLQVIFEQNFPTFVQNGMTTAAEHFNTFNSTVAESLGSTSTVMQTIFETSLPAFAETGTAAVVEKFETMKTNIESILSSIDLSQIGAGGGGKEGEANQAGAGAGASAEGSADISGGGGEGGAEGEATGFIAKLQEQMNQVPVIITAAFTTGINNAMGLYNLLNEYTITLVENINTDLQLLIEYFTTTFNSAVNNAMGTYNLLNDYTAVLAENINTGLQPIIESFTTTFNQAVQNAAGMYNALNDYTKVLVANIDTEIKKVIVSFTAAFTTAVNNAKTNLTALGATAHAVFADVVASVNGAKNAITGLITQINSATSAMGSLKSSADTATSSVEDLASALDNLQDKEITVTTHYVTTGTPAQHGAIIPRFAAGGNMISDFRPNKVLVGENGKELVMLSGGGAGGRTKSFIADHMQDVDIRDKDLTVIPLERRNSENFLKKFPMFKPLVDMLKESKNIPRFAFGVSPSADPNTASGPITTSSDGKVHTWEDGDTALTIDEWNAQSEGTRRGLSESDDVGIKSLPDKSYLENDYSISANDPHGTGNVNGYINNTKWRTGPNAGKQSDAYDSQGNPVGTGGGNGNGGGGGGQQTGTPPRAGSPGYIKPGGWGAGGWYEDWKVVPMRDEPGKWKVIDISDGKNVAVGFDSEEQANAWIDWYVAHPNVKPPGTINNASTGYHGPAQTEGYPTNFGGGTGTGNGGVPSGTPTGSPVDNDWEGIQTTGGEKWTTSPQGDLSATKMTDKAHKGQYKVVDSTGKNVAANFKSEQDANQWIDEYNATNPANGGGTGNGNGGGTGGGTGTFNFPEPLPTTDLSTRYKTSTGYYTHNYVTTEGTGPKWDNPNMDPNSWQAVENDGQWDVVDDKGVNIATGFHTQSGAQDLIDDHREAYTPPLPPTGNGGGGGNGNGGVPPGTPTGTPYTQPDYVQTSGGTKWSTSPGEPSTWQVVPMTDAAHQGEFKVVDAEGKNVAANFKSQQEADDYVNYKKGTPTGGGTGGTGGTPAIPPSTYTAPAAVKNYNDRPDTAPEPNWENVDKTKPEEWRSIKMVDMDAWKVVNKDGKNIAVRFASKTEADEYIAKHQLAKQRGGNAAPIGGGETLQIPGVAAVPPSGGGGTGGGGGGTTGGTVPGYNGNFNYQVNNKGLQITGGTITKNELAAEDWPAADAAFFKATGKHLPPYSSSAAGGGGGGTPIVGDSEGSLPGWGGETYIPGTGGTAKGTGATSGGGGGGTYTGAGTGAQNFAPGSVAGTGGISTGIPNVPGTGGGGGTGTGTGGIGGINFPPGFPFHDRPEVIAGGGPNIGGIQFPKDFPFNNNAAPTGTTAAATGLTQTQSINQASNINGQGNNTNFDTMSGTNSRLQIQNGKVITATGIFANWKLGDPLPGTGGTGGTGTGGIGGALNNPTLQALLHQAPTVPRITSNNYDSMGIPEANERDPLFREFGFNKFMGQGTGGVGGNNPNTPGGGGFGKWTEKIGMLLAQLNAFTQALLGKTLNDKSIWQSMSHITSNNIGTLP